jgi:serine/threonine-protein kinase
MSDELAPSPPSPLAPGDRVLDRYVVIERFEAGGTSVVYRGEDERLARPVCIKVFQLLRERAWLNRTSYEHFVQEAFALSRLTHPNTLTIYDFGHLPGPPDAPGPPFQVSEFMNGGTLSAVIRREGPMARDEAIRVVAAIGGALDEAHHAGIIHRDIKPKNILFGVSGTERIVKLADFGIAKALADDELQAGRAGDTHVVAGRRLLMFSGLWAAPEQLAGQPVGPATDVYSWALVTIFLLTGQAVFSTNEPGEASRQRHDAAALIDRALEGSDVPAAAAALFRRACAFDPEDRVPGAGRFAAELRAALTAPAPGPRPAPAPLVAVPRAASAAPPPVAAVPPVRLTPRPTPQPLDDRRVRFVGLERGVADVAGPGGARVRVTLMPDAGPGPILHIRGLNCFVRPPGGRASGAGQLDADGRLELVAADQRVLATVAVGFGQPAAGHQRFAIGGVHVAVELEDGPAVALDFGPGAECLLIREAPPPAERGRRRR